MQKFTFNFLKILSITLLACEINSGEGASSSTKSFRKSSGFVMNFRVRIELISSYSMIVTADVAFCLILKYKWDELRFFLHVFFSNAFSGGLTGANVGK